MTMGMVQSICLLILAASVLYLAMAIRNLTRITDIHTRAITDLTIAFGDGGPVIPADRAADLYRGEQP